MLNVSLLQLTANCDPIPSTVQSRHHSSKRKISKVYPQPTQPLQSPELTRRFIVRKLDDTSQQSSYRQVNPSLQLLVDLIAVVDDSGATTAALERLVGVAGVGSRGDGRAAVVAGGARDEGALAVGWGLALPLDDESAGGRGEEEDGGDGELHGD
ncbi:hypothetical protein V498_06760 [Pseudogymnoascus sp. VKM F-4517 (FW-2822)]|nr:hypothetical protein V498_06760 [Pseudogymnoascus sp. VKM F-4517 (FW-2822)]